MRGYGSPSDCQTLLPRQAPCYRECWNNHQESPDEHLDTESQVIPWRIGVQPRESAPISGDRARVGINDLAQSMGAPIGEVLSQCALRIPIACLGKRYQECCAREQ